MPKLIKLGYNDFVKNYHFGIISSYPLKNHLSDGLYPQDISSQSNLNISKETIPGNEYATKFHEKVEITNNLKEITKKINCTIDQLEIAWAIKNNNITTYFIKFSDIKQFEDIIKGIEIYKNLNDETCEQIKKILEKFQNEDSNISCSQKNKIKTNKNIFKSKIQIPSYLKKVIIMIFLIIYSQNPLPYKDSFYKIDRIRYGYLKKKYKDFFNNLPFYNHTHKTNNIIYWCWLQGIDNAPELYLSTLNSVKKNCKDFNIIILNESNIYNYVRFPSYITKKYKNGFITQTHFSDLLRLELLINYGGTWIDASVLITKFNENFFNNDLFFFQRRKHGSVGSSWFITSEKESPLLITTRDLLYQYWKNNDKNYNYFLFHLFIAFASERYYKDLNNIPYFGNRKPQSLRYILLKKFSWKKYKNILLSSSVHKLSIKPLKNKNIANDTFYRHIIDEYYPKKQIPSFIQ